MKGAVIKAVAEFAEVVTGGTPSTTKPEYWDGEVPWLNSGSLNEGVITAPSKYISKLGLQNSSAKLMPKDTVLIALTGATTGQVGYLAIEASANQSVTGILPSKEHYPKYLYFFLKSQRKKMLGDAFGGAQPHINQKYVKDFKIPLPPLNDQKRIAHLLGKVEGLIAQRKQHLQQLDDLLKSVFLEMFGEYLKDEKNYRSIVDVCDFIDYRGKTPPRTEVGIPLISAKCVRRGYFDVERLDFVSKETYNSWMTRGFPKANDVLFTTEGATFGYTCRIPRSFQKFAVGQRLITLVCKNGYRSEVLEFFLNDFHIQKKLSSRLSGSAALGIRSAELAKVIIPFPPSGMQDQFAIIVEKVESLKSRYRQSLTDLEMLYGALSQQAFKGELDLSRVPLV